MIIFGDQIMLFERGVLQSLGGLVFLDSLYLPCALTFFVMPHPHHFLSN